MLIERTDAEAEALILWPPDAKSRLTGKDPEEKGKTEDEIPKMVLGNVSQRVRAQSGLSLHLASVPWALGHTDDRGGSVDCREEARQITELWSKAGPPLLLLH